MSALVRDVSGGGGRLRVVGDTDAVIPPAPPSTNTFNSFVAVLEPAVNSNSCIPAGALPGIVKVPATIPSEGTVLPVLQVTEIASLPFTGSVKYKTGESPELKLNPSISIFV